MRAVLGEDLKLYLWLLARNRVVGAVTAVAGALAIVNGLGKPSRPIGLPSKHGPDRRWI